MAIAFSGYNPLCRKADKWEHFKRRFLYRMKKAGIICFFILFFVVFWGCVILACIGER